MYPLQSEERIAEVYSLGDVCIVSCKKGNGSNAFPSKTVSIMATGTPVLASFDIESELCHLLKQFHCGICCEPENPKELAKTILRLVKEPDSIAKMGSCARKLVENEFEKKSCTDKYVSLVTNLLDNNLK